MRRLLFLLLLPTLAAADVPMARSCHFIGEPVLIVVEYLGGIDGWDASIGVGERSGEPVLHTGNDGFFVVSRGTGPFEPPSRRVLESWETVMAPRGVLVPPREGRFDRWRFNLRMVGPFRTVFDLTNHFVIDEPGIYTVFWGAESVYEEESVFEILPSEAALGTNDAEDQP